MPNFTCLCVAVVNKDVRPRRQGVRAAARRPLTAGVCSVFTILCPTSVNVHLYSISMTTTEATPLPTASLDPDE